MKFSNREKDNVIKILTSRQLKDSQTDRQERSPILTIHFVQLLTKLRRGNFEFVFRFGAFGQKVFQGPWR